MAISLLAVVALCSFGSVVPTAIDIPECEPPDFPKHGGYGPPQPFYLPGDQIHYYCDTDRYIGGNFLRICEDTGDWSGVTPVCDAAAEWASFNMSSTFDREAEHGAERSADDRRDTCSLTRKGVDQYWTGMLKYPGELIRVMVFSPKVHVDYEVFLLKNGGQKFSCGRRTGHVHRLNWEFHKCPVANNKDAIGVQIITKSPDVGLHLCEVVAHVLTPPTCEDPRYRITNGRLELTRKTAVLVCDAGFTKSADKSLDCVRGVWTRKPLRCLERNA